MKQPLPPLPPSPGHEKEWNDMTEDETRGISLSVNETGPQSEALTGQK
jgi:hypothetical protein